MHKFKGLMTSLSPHWATPKGLYEKLNSEFSFDFDPCPLCNISNFDGLTCKWGSSNFINPPYGRDICKWIARAVEVAQGGGNLRIAYSKSDRYKMVARLYYESR